MKKKSLLTFLFAMLCIVVGAQTVKQTMYLDFGENNKDTRGRLTEGADALGHYWTNIYSSESNYCYPGASFNIVNSSNESTGYSLLVNVRFTTNGKSGGGGLLSPSSDLLGDLAQETATEDYFFLESWQHNNFMTFKGLDKSKGYRFYIFGSRVQTQDRAATFKLQGETIWNGDQAMSGTGIGANSYNGNNNKILVSDVIFPDKDGNITMTMIKKYADRMAHINAMKIEEVEGVERPNQAYTLKQKLYMDFGENNNTRGTQTTGADKNGNYWNNLVSAPSGSDYIIPIGTTANVINSANESTGYTATLVTKMYTNGMTGGGGLNDPTDENLGDLAIQTATEDYVWVAVDGKRQFKLSGLNKNNVYKFYIFGSRDTDENRHSIYTLEGMSKWSTIFATSGSDIGGKGVQHNVRNVAVSDYLFPDKDGNILFSLERYNSTGYGHFNVIKVEEYTGAVRPVEPISLSSVSISGTASEGGEDVEMNELKPSGTSTGIFEAYLKMQAGTYSLKGITTDNENVTLGAGATEGSVAEDGTAFTSTKEQVVRVRYDSKNAAITVTPVTLYLKGNIVPANTTVEYEGKGVWKSTVDMNYGTVFLFSDKYFYFAFNNSDDLAVKRITSDRTSVGMPAEGFAAENIRLNRGTYTLTLDMKNYKWDIDAPINQYKISAFGSSVCNGQGATNNQGYAYLYGEYLENRYNNNLSTNLFEVSGIAIGGNTTVNLLARYDEMIHDFGHYVLIGLSLGNEGIHGASNQQAIFDQFSNNMQTLITKMRADGKEPVIMNNYTRGDYVESDYNYVKKMNLLIHEWDVPSINMLGAIDDGTGKWATSYQNGTDVSHPNTAGHREFFYAMPPSLFDALKQGKALPTRNLTTEMTLKDKDVVSFKGESIVHPYTISVRFKGGAAGTIFNFGLYTGSYNATVSINESGNVVYTSTKGTTLTSTANVNDDAWHIVTLTHYYAQARTLLYVDGVSAGEISGSMLLGNVNVGDINNTVERKFSEVSFWRSALSPDEVAAHVSGKMLKSSLDIYAPLSDDSKETIANLAQSLNTVSYVKADATGIKGVTSVETTAAKTVYDVDGKFIGKNMTSVNNLKKGLYLINGKKMVIK